MGQSGIVATGIVRCKLAAEGECSVKPKDVRLGVLPRSFFAELLKNKDHAAATISQLRPYSELSCSP